MAYAGHDGLPNTKVIISDAPLSGAGTNADHLKINLHTAAEKVNLVNADEVFGADSASTFSLIRTTWTNVKVFLKSYFDGIYSALGHTHPATEIGNPVTRVTTISTTELTTDVLIVCNSAGAITVNLLAATGSDRIRQVANINTGAVTIEGDAGDTIDGELTQVIYQWETIDIKDYAANKWKIK